MALLPPAARQACRSLPNLARLPTFRTPAPLPSSSPVPLVRRPLPYPLRLYLQGVSTMLTVPTSAGQKVRADSAARSCLKS